MLQRLSEMMQLPEVMRDEFDELMTGAGSKLPQAIRETLEALKPGSDSELVRPGLLRRRPAPPSPSLQRPPSSALFAPQPPYLSSPQLPPPMHDRVGSPPPRLGASPKLGSVEWAELSWGRRRAPEPPPLDTGAAMATKALHALKEFAAGLPDESSQTAFAAGAEPVYAFCERYKGGLIDNSTGIVCRLIERFLAVERFYPDDRSELLGVTKLSAHHSDNGKTLQARCHCHYHRHLHLTSPPIPSCRRCSRTRRSSARCR